jgi:hypothetical protein
MSRQQILRLAAAGALALAGLQAAACSSTSEPSAYRFARPGYSGPDQPTANSATVRNQMTDPLGSR